jgi:hypothetical protein
MMMEDKGDRALPSERAGGRCPEPAAQSQPSALIPSAAFDKTGRQIKVGDVLKVYHFQGARWRKRYFMYKQVIGERVFGASGVPRLLISHLNMKEWSDRDGGYSLAQDGQILPDVEIVQGLDWHHDRPVITRAGECA